MIMRTLVAVYTMVLLTGCGSSPPVRYYTLEPLDTNYVTDPEGSPVLGVGPMRVPDYLDRNQIVVRGANAELIVYDFDRWAEPLDEALHRILATNVDTFIDDVIVIAYPYNALMAYDYRVVGRIDRFDASAGGDAVFAVHWAISDRDGDPVTQPRRSRYTAQVSNVDDPGSIARALSQCLGQCSKDIAKEFEAVVR